MTHSDRNPKQVRSFLARLSGAVGLFFALALLLAPTASATYEQVGGFGPNMVGNPSEERSLLASAKGMAVNVTGAGGASPGTVYVARPAFQAPIKGLVTEFNGLPTYSAKGEFLGEWGHFGGGAQGVAVDQATGDVYVLRQANGENEKGVVQVYSADGSQLIASFGETGAFNETTDEGPEKIHIPASSGIAVDNSGVVYVSDANGEIGSRVMVFEPQSPGDYENYVYAGQVHDIVARFPEALALDSAGNLYLVGEENAIYEFSPGEPATPSCEFQLPTGGIEGMTVNPASGEVFYFTYKNKKIHQLVCNPQGKFVETTSFKPTPQAGEIYALALNPALAWEASRPVGVLYAINSQSGQEIGDIFAPAKFHTPTVESESVSSVTSSTAVLGAQINPKGSETRYAFQYITDAAYQANEPTERFVGATEAPLGGAVLGSGQAALSAAASLTGLQPDTEYRYRVLATHCEPGKEEELCRTIGPAQAFRTFPAEAPGLPDNRAYELVSPAQKHGGEVFPADPQIASCGTECKPGAVRGAGVPMQSGPDGEAVVYEGFPFSFTEGAAVYNEYLSKRTESGWQTTILSPLLQVDEGYKAFNAELTRGLFEQGSPTLSPEAPSGYANLYTQPADAPASLTPLIKNEPPHRLQINYAGASADFSQLFFEANDALTSETPFAPEAVDGGANKNNLYESVGGQLQLVNVLPDNAETAPGAEFGSGEQLKSGNTNNITSDFSHAISADGSRVFWSSEGGQVYVRENGESTASIPDTGRFLSASADGAKVLLDDGHIYDLESEVIVDLTESEGGFEGIVGQSEDLSSVYFVDTAVLTGGEENEEGAKAQAGKDNLYAWQEGASAFVATLDPGDNPTGETSFGGGDWFASPSIRSAEASPDGRWVAFLSKAPLTGYDNVGPSCVLNSTGEGEQYVNGLCSEVFLYDSASGKLICPSCDPSGERPLGSSHLSLIYLAEGSLPQPRYLTDEGRLYFDTRDSLTPFDTNNGVEDVYQYEPEGIGSCKREDGCVSLISAGHEPVDSNFLAADASGKNVFFTSRDQLVLKDRDDLVDLYDAREGGGIPAETETARGECQGEACQPVVTPPNDPTPGSSSFEGAGNVVEEKPSSRCPKGKARRKGRCVAKHHKRAKRAHHRANNNRGGAQ